MALRRALRALRRLDADERRELYAALLEGSDEADAGQGEDLAAVIAEVEART